MIRPSISQLQALLILLVGLASTPTTRADALSAVQVLREGGCGGILPAAQPLRHNALLDLTARRWASGGSISAATERSGYRARSTLGLHLSGSDSAMLSVLRRADCGQLTDRALHDIGVYRHGLDTWLVLASAYVVPADAQSPALANRALQLVNEARERGTRCGARWFAPAPPLTLSATLAGVALGHATDMAEHDYFEHHDLTGKSPADRVRAVGYREKLVGENIAYGPETVPEVVQGWLDSPGHCENIMDPRFEQMGLAHAAGRAFRYGLYWVQLLAAPR